MTFLDILLIIFVLCCAILLFILTLYLCNYTINLCFKKSTALESLLDESEN